MVHPLENGTEVHAVLFDFQKLFDSVPHCLLIEKLRKSPVMWSDGFPVT